MTDNIPIIVAFLLYLTRVREFFIKRDTFKGPVKEKFTFLLLFLSGTGIVLAAMLEYFLLEKSVSYPHVVIGTIVFIAALIYRNWAISTLGKFWSVHVEIRSNHQLIKTGPFKHVRHPVYTGAILEVVGAVLILQAYYSALVIPVFLIPAIILRIRLEERELIAKFGDEYREYIKQTGALFPKPSRSK